MKLTEKTKDILQSRFGKDSEIALATVENGIPFSRTVDALYYEGKFYIITYALSRKIKQIETNPNVAISGEWFTAHGIGINKGWFCKEENKEIAKKLRDAFAFWIDNGHNDFDDENTIILCVELTEGILFAEGIKYNIDFK